jgi:hypothetical protein
MASADLNNNMLQPYLAERKRMEGLQNYEEGIQCHHSQFCGCLCQEMRQPLI